MKLETKRRLSMLLLAVAGFVSSRADEQVTQPDSAITGVVLAFSAMPAMLALISLPFIVRYGRIAPPATTTEPIEAGSRPLVSDQAKKPAISAKVSSGRMKRRRRIYSAGCSGGA